ncbi:MAG: pyridoxamine 5'-phosphate oxidase, partial [Ginsengibacter sp.]
MTLATCDSSGKPSARIVLLKGLHENGFLFFTNYDSRKGKEIENNPFACLVFLWKEIERQVRIEGTVEKIDEAESDAYFNNRPRESRIGAWSSHQSSPIESREILEKNYEKYSNQFNTGDIPRPKNWGGYIVHPNLIEFWQGRQGRLHDRLQYTLDVEKIWKIERLSP